MVKIAAVIVLTSSLLTGNHASSSAVTVQPAVTVGSSTVSNSAGIGQ